MIHAEKLVAKLIGEANQMSLPPSSHSLLPEPSSGLPTPDEIVSPVLQGFMDRRQHGKPVDDFRISDQGVMNCQYFQGAGVAFSSWEGAYVGTGENAYEALEDALEGAAQDDWDIRRIENKFDPQSEDNVQAAVREANPDMEEDDLDDCESYYYVVLYVKGLDKEGETT